MNKLFLSRLLKKTNFRHSSTMSDNSTSEEDNESIDSYCDTTYIPYAYNTRQIILAQEIGCFGFGLDGKNTKNGLFVLNVKKKTYKQLIKYPSTFKPSTIKLYIDKINKNVHIFEGSYNNNKLLSMHEYDMNMKDWFKVTTVHQLNLTHSLLCPYMITHTN